MWLPLTCPNVTALFCSGSTLTAHPPLPAPPAAQRPSPPPVALQHLRDFRLGLWHGTLSVPQDQHLQQQLAALPSLARLQRLARVSTADGLHSTSVTRLHFEGEEDEEDAAQSLQLQRLPAQFPNLVELDAPACLTLDDDNMEALLSMRSLRRVLARDLRLERSHAQRPCCWEELVLCWLDVDSVARLPLEGIQRLCCRGDEVHPSRDAQAVARVAAAIKRFGGLGTGYGFSFIAEDPAALLATLRPLLEALPADQQRKVAIVYMGEDAAPGVLQQLGQQLPPTVHTLRLHEWARARNAWAAVLPSLPATVTRLELSWWVTPPQVDVRVLALCSAAVRPITVSVRRLRDEVQQHILHQLAQQGNTHVTLVFE